LLSEPVYQHIDEHTHLAAQVPAMGIERIDLQHLCPVVGQQRDQRSRGYQVRNQERRRQYQADAALAAVDDRESRSLLRTGAGSNGRLEFCWQTISCRCGVYQRGIGSARHHHKVTRLMISHVAHEGPD
jgi:hypothetical protein